MLFLPLKISFSMNFPGKYDESELVAYWMIIIFLITCLKVTISIFGVASNLDNLSDYASCSTEFPQGKQTLWSLLQFNLIIELTYNFVCWIYRTSISPLFCAGTHADIQGNSI